MKRTLAVILVLLLTACRAPKGKDIELTVFAAASNAGARALFWRAAGPTSWRTAWSWPFPRESRRISTATAA